MKTTPGPWFARHNGHFWEVNISCEEFAHSVAHVFDRRPLEGDAEANAHLIASSPDLLAERDQLKAMNAELVDVVTAYVAYDKGDHEDGVLMMLHYAEMLKAARAALAKHKGETA